MKTLSLCVLAVSMACCTPKKERNPEPAPTEIGDTVLPDAVQHSGNSLDYLGLYKGKLRCDGCPGIATSVELAEDFSFVMASDPIGSKQHKKEVRGTFKWNAEGNGIELNAAGEAPVRFFVADDQLIPADASWNKVAGTAPDRFRLTKVSELEAVRSDALPEDRGPQDIRGIHWTLTQLQDLPISKESGRDYYIEFQKDGRFTAFAGCNRLAGDFSVDGSKIRMSKIVTTMMACPDLKTEERLRAAVETADNFVANEQLLQLRKGGRNLAKFELLANPGR